MATEAAGLMLAREAKRARAPNASERASRLVVAPDPTNQTATSSGSEAAQPAGSARTSSVRGLGSFLPSHSNTRAYIWPRCASRHAATRPAQPEARASASSVPTAATGIARAPQRPSDRAHADPETGEGPGTDRDRQADRKSSTVHPCSTKRRWIAGKSSRDACPWAKHVASPRTPV